MNEKIDIDIVEIDVHHPLYNEECQLRFDLVRLPLGITHKDAEKFADVLTKVFPTKDFEIEFSGI